MKYAVFTLVWLLPVLAAAEWSIDPQQNNPVCTDYATQSDAISVSDGAGGLITVWEDNREGDIHLYAQRIGASGSPVWTANGIRVCTYASTQTDAAVLGEGNGGAIVVWKDDSGGNVNLYGQRIGPDGTLLWAPTGQAICTTTGSQADPKISSDGTGGVLVVWTDFRGTDADIYMQRVDLAGYPQWSSAGEPVCTESGAQYAEGVTYDTVGGGIAVWIDTRESLIHVFARRVNSLGTPLWIEGGNRVSLESTDDQFYPVIASNDDGGAFVAWARQDPADPSLEFNFIQHISAAGVRLWDDNGKIVHGGTGIYTSFPDIVPDGDGGAFLVWQELVVDGGYNVAGQHYNVNGLELWGIGGLPLCVDSGVREFVYLIADGAGGMIAAWSDYRNGLVPAVHSMYAQRVDALGIRLWGDNGLAVNIGSVDQYLQTPVADGEGGLVIAWDDSRVSQSDIYAQKVHATGYLGNPDPVVTDISDVPNDQGGEVLVAWDSGYLDAWPHRAVESYSVWMREAANKAGTVADAKAAYTYDPQELAAISEKLNLPDDAIQTLIQTGWIYVTLVPATLSEDYACFAPTLADSSSNGVPMHEYKVIAHDGTPWPFWESNLGSGYSVDNLAPSAPVNLAGEFTQPGEVGLSWEASGHHDEDLSYYVVYRGDSTGFPLDENHQVGTSTDLEYLDPAGSGVWFYRVTAVDVHDNESDGSNEVEVTDATDVTEELPDHFALRGNYPNPFNPSTEIQFDLAGECQVTLKVLTVEGRLVTTLVNQILPRGAHWVTWNGRGATGRQLASGVYYCRLDAGDFVATHKLVMVK